MRDVEVSPQPEPTGLRRLAKLYLAAAVWGPLLFLTPTGAVGFLGFRDLAKAMEPWAFGALVVFPLVAALVAYWMPGAVRLVHELIAGSIGRVVEVSARVGKGALSWFVTLALLAVLAFIILGVIGLLSFGVKQL